MPIIIHELITTIEAPESSDRHSSQPGGLEEAEVNTLKGLELTKEREERLLCD